MPCSKGLALRWLCCSVLFISHAVLCMAQHGMKLIINTPSVLQEMRFIHELYRRVLFDIFVPSQAHACTRSHAHTWPAFILNAVSNAYVDTAQLAIQPSLLRPLRSQM